MQNKNRLLNRGGFAVIAAVFMMLLISLMLLKMISYSTDVAQRTTNDYLSEQAQLLAFNATEDAVFQISGQCRNSATCPALVSGGSCIQSITSNYPSSGTTMFNINTTIKYVWSDDPSLGADRLSSLPATCIGTNLFAAVSAPQQHGAALIDVFVTSATALGLDEPIRFHRRTLQKL